MLLVELALQPAADLHRVQALPAARLALRLAQVHQAARLEQLQVSDLSLARVLLGVHPVRQLELEHQRVKAHLVEKGLLLVKVRALALVLISLACRPSKVLRRAEAVAVPQHPHQLLVVAA